MFNLPLIFLKNESLMTLRSLERGKKTQKCWLPLNYSCNCNEICHRPASSYVTFATKLPTLAINFFPPFLFLLQPSCVATDPALPYAFVDFH